MLQTGGGGASQAAYGSIHVGTFTTVGTYTLPTSLDDQLQADWLRVSGGEGAGPTRSGWTPRSDEKEASDLKSNRVAEIGRELLCCHSRGPQIDRPDRCW